MNSTARTARENALKRHRRQTLVTATISSLLGIIIGEVRHLESWSSGKGPAMQKLEVRAYGYVDKEGAWRSYDTGEKIEALGWKPN